MTMIPWLKILLPIPGGKDSDTLIALASAAIAGRAHIQDLSISIGEDPEGITYTLQVVVYPPVTFPGVEE